MKIRQLTPEEIKGCRLSVWILAIILSWIIITGPAMLIYDHIVTRLFDVPVLSLSEISGWVAACCALDLFVFGWKKKR